MLAIVRKSFKACVQKKRMESYEKLLEEAYAKVKVVRAGGERFEMPKLESQIVGKNTIVSNLAQVAGILRRDINQLARFLQKELSLPSKIENNRLVIIGKVSSGKLNEKLALYVEEFVKCAVCKKVDTELVSEKGIKFKHCLACGAKSPVKYHF